MKRVVAGRNPQERPTAIRPHESTAATPSGYPCGAHDRNDSRVVIYARTGRGFSANVLAPWA